MSRPKGGGKGSDGAKTFGMKKVGQKKRALEKRRRKTEWLVEDAPKTTRRKKKRHHPRRAEGEGGGNAAEAVVGKRKKAPRDAADGGPARHSRARKKVRAPGRRPPPSNVPSASPEEPVRSRPETPRHQPRPASRAESAGGAEHSAAASPSAALRLVATCGLGVESLLANELRELGVAGIHEEQGAVVFRGTWRDCWRANMHLRTANRVLVEVGGFRVESDQDLYPGALELFNRNPELGGVPFSEIAHPKRSLSVRATSRASRIRDVRWLALKIKDALVDSQRDRTGRRGDVARRGADVPLRVFLQRNHASILLDTSGRPLDHRNYRAETTTAPVREQLAAACVLAAEYEGPGPVFDPMCGSGTLLIEASWALDGGAPGRLRRSWVFERWPSFVRSEFKTLELAVSEFEPRTELIGADTDPEAVRAARINFEAAGVAEVARVRRADALHEPPPAESGLLLVNPAYGRRLSSTPDFWPMLGDILKQKYTGWRAVVLAGDEHRGKRIGLRASRKLTVWNGSIQARILVFDLY